MSEATLPAGAVRAPAMGLFERWLTLWVALCIVAGILLGQAIPGVFEALGRATVAEVNLPVAILVWLMIVPMLLKIDLGALSQVGAHWRGIATTVGVNWLVKPFSMALLGWLFIGTLFRPWLPADQIDSYMAGLILLVAMIGAIVLTHRQRGGVRTQNISLQNQRRPQDATRLVDPGVGQGMEL